jgi:glycosyltransferase involved in cell wall biosynthesis
MPRVLLVFEYPSVHGGENSQLATLRHLTSAGFDMLALAPPHGPLARALTASGVEVIPWDVRGGDGRRGAHEQVRQALVHSLETVRPDLVHANSLSMARLVGPVTAAYGIASIGHLRDMLRVSSQAMHDLSQNSRLLAVSRAAHRWHVRAGISAHRVRVLYNGVDLDRFRPRHPTGYLHRELRIAASCRLIGTIGQIGMRKGLDVWLAAAENVAKQHSDVHFLIVGKRYSEKDEARQFEANLRQRCLRSELVGRVHFLGCRMDVDQILNELTLLVHAARQEPLGRVLLEAGASGTPVVATDVGGTSEIFPSADQSTAVLVPAEDEGALSDAVGRMLADEALRRNMGQAARRRVEARFDVQRVARRLAGHYRQVLGMPRIGWR